MNRLNLVLIAATILLAGITVHYAHALTLQRELNVRSVSIPASVSEVNGEPSPLRTSATAEGVEPPAAATESIAPSYETDRFDPADIALSKYRLNDLRDPRGRAQKLRELAESIQSDLAPVAPYIGISSGELDRSAQVGAEKDLEQEMRALECRLEPKCDVDAFAESQPSPRQRILDMIGAETMARLDDFKRNDQRELVRALQQAVPAANTLSAMQAQNLVRALAEESQKIEAETDADEERYDSMVAGWEGVLLHVSYKRGGAGGYKQQQLDSAKRYSQRLHTRAAALLSATQLAEFKVIQDRVVMEYAQWEREEDIKTDARMNARRDAAHAQ